MFVAHVPAGYIVAAPLADRLGRRHRAALGIGLVAAVLPDIDLLYFYAFANRHVSHHDYWTHTPLAWVAAGIVIAVVLIMANRRRWLPLLGIALLNVELHFVLDSLAADIRWLYPLSPVRYELVHVPLTHRPWWLSFLLHWTFGIELAIVAAAGLYFASRRRSRA
ncbi:metal-dependent hydrolase [Mangrovibrevibacter kandeliae]|uniref:metal-dependent hydrolase n=1 Tax=Mangrovibrevibacter kandeliae TaxID=2968473 RepID=UPI0021198615|nr:metal-dependent hydrolase [Aurantimonas sp. CSK15Z-1]MCQ8781905.1 metal-dependent hydrolase [Aurantimonas sp. CSK15Z-1]